VNRIQRRLVELAAQLLNTTVGRITVIVSDGTVQIVHPEPVPLPPGQLPEGMSEYDAAIIQAVTSSPVSAPRLARLSGHPYNAWFRKRLARLVEDGYIRRTRRGYQKGFRLNAQ